MMVSTAVVLMVLARRADHVQERARDQRFGGAARRRQPEPARRHQPADPRSADGRAHHRRRRRSPMPTGAGITFARPGPVALNFDMIADSDSTLQLPSIIDRVSAGPDHQQLDDRHHHDHDRRRVHAGGHHAGDRRRLAGAGARSRPTARPSSSPRRRSGLTATRSTTRRRSRSAIWCCMSAQNGNAIQTVTSIDTVTASHLLRVGRRRERLLSLQPAERDHRRRRAHWRALKDPAARGAARRPARGRSLPPRRR